MANTLKHAGGAQPIELLNCVLAGPTERLLVEGRTRRIEGGRGSHTLLAEAEAIEELTSAPRLQNDQCACLRGVVRRLAERDPASRP
jgi:hypothetical protein